MQGRIYSQHYVADEYYFQTLCGREKITSVIIHGIALKLEQPQSVKSNIFMFLLLIFYLSTVQRNFLL